MRNAVLMFFFCATCFPGLAQECSFQLKGLVEDSDGIQLPGATILLENTNVGATSLADGLFVINNLCKGEYVLVVKYIGYEDQQLSVKVPSSKSIIIKLKPAVKILHDVVIEGDHVQSHGLSQTVTILSQRDLEASKGKPLGELLSQVPGVNAIMTGPAIYKPIIHGLHSQRILILNNGIRQEGQQWGIEHAPEIDTYIASEVEVVKGAETVRYGADAIGGVILINTPALHQTSAAGGEFNAGWMSNNRMGTFSGMLEGGLKKWTGWGWRLQGTIKRGGDYHAADYNLSNTGTKEINFSGTLGFKKANRNLEIYVSSFNTEIGILRSAHTGNLDDLQSSIENKTPWFIKDFTYRINSPHQEINHHLLKLKASFALQNIGRLNFLYGGQYNQRKEFDIRRAGRSDKPALSLQLFSNVFDASLDHTLGKWNGSVGLNGTFKNNDNVRGTGISPLIPDYHQYSGGVFVMEKLRKGKWLFEVGGRYDHQYLQVLTFDQQDQLVKPSYNFNYVSGTIGASYYFSQRVRLTSNVGLSSRPPHVSELYSDGLHHGTASIEEGIMRMNGELMINQSSIKKEVSHKWINTLQISSEKLSVEISAHANVINNYVYLRPSETRLTIRGYFPVFQHTQTDAILAGSDVAITCYLIKRLNYQGKLSYLFARDVTHNDHVPFIPPAQFENGLTYTWPKVGRWKDLYVALNAPIVFKQTRAPVTVYPRDVPEYSGEKLFDFMPAPDAYILFNIAVGSKLNLRNRDITVILSAENLLNTSYRNYMNRLRYYADDVGRNIMVRVKYNFHSHD